jgi:hypothetical protein
LKKLIIIVALLTLNLSLCFASDGGENGVVIKITDSNNEVLTGVAVLNDEGKIVGYSDFNGDVFIPNRIKQSSREFHIELVSYKPANIGSINLSDNTVIQLNSL